jgi:hypothetical protein
MILNYIEYLFENVDEKIPFYLSKELRNILKNIYNSKKEGYEVAQFLLKKHLSEDYEDDANYIDITKTNDKLSFISMNRSKRFWEKGEENPGMTFKDWSQRMWFDQEIDVKKKVWKEQRTEVFVGRFVNRVYQKSKSSISSSELEKFVNLYKSAYDRYKDVFSRFEIVKGEEIKKWYLIDNYETQYGQLGASCMRFKSKQDFFDIYIKNPEVVSLLILKSEDELKISGRALLWKLTNGEIFMDRIYTNKDSDIILFEEYGNKNNWLVKSEILYAKLKKLTVELSESKFEYYPYLDTFAYLNVDKKLLATDEDLWPGQGYIKLDSTEGEYASDDLVWSEWDEDWLDRDNAVFCERRGEWVSSYNATYLEYVGEWAHPNDDISFSKYDGENYYAGDVVFSNILDSDILFDDAISIILDSDLDDEYIHKDFEKSLIEVEIEGEKHKAPKEKLVNWKGKYIFIDQYIGIIKKEDFEEVSDDEFKEYILNLDISIDKNNVLLSRFNFDRMDISVIYDLIKILILSSKEIKEKGGVSHELLRQSITNHSLYGNLPEQIKRSIRGFLSKTVYSYWLFTRAIVSDIIKDPKMFKYYLEKTT